MEFPNAQHLDVGKHLLCLEGYILYYNRYSKAFIIFNELQYLLSTVIRDENVVNKMTYFQIIAWHVFDIKVLLHID